MNSLSVITLFALASIGLTCCTTESADRGKSCCATLAAPVAFGEKSIYQAESAWTTDAGKEFKLSELRGRPQVVAMFFANCQFACPILVNDLKRLESSLPESVRAQTGFTLVSFDTERDTSEALAQYRKTHRLATDRWTLLRGNPDDVLELAALLGVKFKADANGQFAHSNVYTVLNEAGEIVFQQAGLNQDIQKAGATLQKLTER